MTTDLHPGLLVSNLFIQKETHHNLSIHEATVRVAAITNEITFMNQVLSGIRNDRRAAGDADTVNLDHRFDELMRVREICERVRDQYPEIFGAADRLPFDEDIDLTAIPHDHLEWVDDMLHNIETKDQSQIQIEMSKIEIESHEMRQLLEIVFQIIKSLRDSDSYHIRKQ